MQTDTIIAIAVEWWREHLEYSDEDGPQAELVANTIRISNEQLTEEKIELFAKKLTKYLKKAKKNSVKGIVTLCTDHAPEGVLATICRELQISGVQFPNKATMVIDFKRKSLTWSILHGPSGRLYPLN